MFLLCVEMTGIGDYSLTRETPANLWCVSKTMASPRPTAVEEWARPRYLTVNQLVERWQISRAHAYRLIERGTLPSLRAGAVIRIPITAVEAHERRSADA